jgi:2-oxoisovalerate dehydrogenase E1 component alpha subunit
MTKWTELLSKFKSPVARFEKYMLKRGLIKEGDSNMFRDEAKELVRDALKNSMGVAKPSIDEMFTDVYDTVPKSLNE